MHSTLTRRFIARLIFISGLLLMVVGSIFLLTIFPGTSRRYALTAFLFIIIGALFISLVAKLNKRSLYLFVALLFLQIGFFLLLFALSIIPVSFSQGWPFISIFTGFALFPSSWYRYRTFHVGYLVSSLAFVILGCILLLFSFDVVNFPFKKFILEWWPLILFVSGLVLVFVSLGTKNKAEEIKR
ncbi:MAG: hypothetical protein LBU28_07430 [Spirochaetaceae bacterium]|jgi:hypothetical protein|nr:hypothetical protein [Spirochaetaceae bacterium]